MGNCALREEGPQMGKNLLNTKQDLLISTTEVKPNNPAKIYFNITHPQSSFYFMKENNISRMCVE